MCTNTTTVSVGAVAAKFLGIPHVWWIHEFGYEDQGLAYDLGTSISLMLINRLSAICVANSHAVAKSFQSAIPTEKLRVVYGWVNTEARARPTPLTPLPDYDDVDIRCAFVGNLNEGKRPEDAIKAIADLVRRGRRPLLYVIGSGSAERETCLRGLIRDHALERYVALLGYVDNPLELVRKADCLLMCSLTEAFGRVTVEGMLAGKPVVGARGGATPELICDRFNGLLYQPGSHSDLADKIDYLCENPAIASQMGENGKRWAAEHFGKARCAMEALNVLTEATHRADNGRRAHASMETHGG